MQIASLSATLLFAVSAVGAGTSCTDVFPTPGGKSVGIGLVKHASVRIRYEGLEIQIDPVGRAIAPETDWALFPKADLILVTHEHFDHFDPAAIAALRKEETEVFANPAVCGLLGGGVALANGGTVPWWREDVSIEAVPAYNTTPGREKFHPKGRDNGYVLTLGGLRIYVAGDTEDIPEMAAIRDIDIAFLPCNQPYTMTPAQLAGAAKVIRPKVLFPYHRGDTPEKEIAAALDGSGIDVRFRGAP
ncbi:MAG: MBL fold metallo-hydrolase [Kiritimatiellae bacterium]|nr:MBL fold metallo-hydrolase [Kiritimatiellia bacterium]